MIRRWLERVLPAGEGGGARKGERLSGPRGAELRSGDLLVWFMRLVAVMWLAKGLMHWSVVLGVADQPGRRFVEMAMSAEAATVFFAVIDVVAAVGLWMVSAWGGVVWIIAAGAHAALDLFAPQIFGRQLTFVAAVIALIGVYFALTWLAARDAREGSTGALVKGG